MNCSRQRAAALLLLILLLAPAIPARGQEAGPVITVQPKAPLLVTGSRRLPPLPAGAFTIVVIPDTQAYRGTGCKLTPDSTEPVANPNLEAQVDWIVRNRDRENIAFVTHTGDIVDRNRPEQWAVARRQLDRLRGSVPFSLSVGNHDMTAKGNAELFQQHFPAASFRTYPWYLGCYEHTREDQRVSANNVNSAQLFQAGGTDFLHISLECNAPDDVLAWAGALLSRYASRRALISTHMDLGIVEKPVTEEGFFADPKGRMRWVKVHGARGNSGEQLWQKLFRRHPNLALILCGDQSRVTAHRLDSISDSGRFIPSLMSDYMSAPVLRLLRFRPRENRIDVLTLEARRELLVESAGRVKDPVQHQFTLPYPMAP